MNNPMGLIFVEQRQDDQRMHVEAGEILANWGKRLGELHVGGAKDRVDGGKALTVRQQPHHGGALGLGHLRRAVLDDQRGRLAGSGQGSEAAAVLPARADLVDRRHKDETGIGLAGDEAADLGGAHHGIGGASCLGGLFAMSRGNRQSGVDKELSHARIVLQIVGK